ncbi:unnamed protein product [Effrenium voratum]|nr:unnamed protein product [Effrenium voratum]
MPFAMKSVMALAALAAPGLAITTRSDSNGNPIRKVVSMMEKMADKIEAEAKTESEQYEKFGCYCKKTIAELEKNIQQAETSPISQADIDKKESEITSLEQELKKLKDDRIAEEETLKSAESQRGKEHGVFVKEVTEEEEVVQSIDSATAALGSGSAASFLQRSNVTRMLRAVEGNQRLTTDAKQKVVAFLANHGTADPGYVMGMLSEIKDDTKEEIDTETKTEDNAVVNFQEVETAKTTEISSLLSMFERKMKTIGELKVEVVNLKREMSEQGTSVEDDKKMLAELQKSCAEKAKDGEQRKAARAEEQLALQDTIKMLMSDNSLDLFRSRSPAFLQLSSQQKAKQAAALLKAAAKASNRPELNFLALALAGKKADFTKILEKIDGMVALMKQEGADDKSKKEYCEKEFRGVAAKSKSLESKMKTLAASVTEKKGAIAKLSEDIAALQSGVQALDSSVATAGSNRKAEHAEFQESTASNSAALELLSMAKNRLNKVYNPSMVAATTTKSPYDLSLLQLKGEQPPALPEGGYQTKMQESNGVMKMMDTLTNDMEKEMAVAKTEEADAQVDYQDTVKDATAKREADLALVQQKVTDKADLESDLNDDQTDLGGKKKELVAAGKYTEDLHQECDWLLKNFELRVQARTEEKENLIRAKTVLGGM